jgi:hypothetical protein
MEPSVGRKTAFVTQGIAWGDKAWVEGKNEVLGGIPKGICKLN